MWEQVKKFDPSKGGNVHLECLKNVRLGFGIASKYLTALQAWNNTQQHKDRNFPTGVSVPLYYTYSSAGHINVLLPDGRVWSDGTFYANLYAYESTHQTVRFLGWGESINGVPVLKWVADPTPPPPPSHQTLHLDKGTDTTTFRADGSKIGVIHAVDNTYDYIVLENLGNRVRINSVSGGGNNVWVYMTYAATGKPIPGRSLK